MFKIHYLLLLFLVACSTMPSQKQEEVKETTNNEQTVITLQNKKGNKAEITNFGARLMSWYVQDDKGQERNIVLGFATKEAYAKADAPFYGAIVGRYANRIENFTLDGKDYKVTDGEYLLHSGKTGFHYQMWKVEEYSSSHVILSYLSKDGEAGFPGNLQVYVTYTLTDDNELKIVYAATTDKTTVCNLTNHAFFNLKGAGNGSVEDLQLKINADEFTPLKEGGLPTGEIRAVENTALDFRKFKTVGAAFNATSDEQIKVAKGIDHNFVNPSPSETFITAIDPVSHLKMEMKSTLPGAQVFTAHFLTGNDIGVDGKPFKAKEAICFEAQFFANAPKHPNFPSVVLKPGEKYKHSTSYKVSVDTSQFPLGK